MRININLKRGPEQQRFLDYFNSRLGSRLSNSQGTAGFREDGTFESVVSGPFNVHQGSIFELSWKYVKSHSGELLFIDVEQVTSDDTDMAWRDAVNELVVGALTSALESRRRQFFRRNTFNYIGPQLDGEYWFGAIRFAPVWPDDNQPSLINAERVICIDQVVSAIDGMDASSLAQQSSARVAARLSLLLNRGLYRPPPEMRWVQPIGDVRSIRGNLTFNGYGPSPSSLPAKGETCEPGKWAGALAADYITIGRLSLPTEARRVLRAIDQAAPAIVESFDRAARLYQVATVLQQQFPSVGLAYRVAAVEALSKSDPSTIGFSDFMRKNVKSLADPTPILSFLYGTVRSAHFHAGEFPLGEYDLLEFPRAFMSSEYIESTNLRRRGFEITREAIVNWLIARLPLVD